MDNRTVILKVYLMLVVMILDCFTEIDFFSSFFFKKVQSFRLSDFRLMFCSLDHNATLRCIVVVPNSASRLSKY